MFISNALEIDKIVLLMYNCMIIYNYVVLVLCDYMYVLFCHSPYVIIYLLFNNFTWSGR
jgi:hypothetical protein